MTAEPRAIRDQDWQPLLRVLKKRKTTRAFTHYNMNKAPDHSDRIYAPLGTFLAAFDGRRGEVKTLVHEVGHTFYDKTDPRTWHPALEDGFMRAFWHAWSIDFEVMSASPWFRRLAGPERILQAGRDAIDEWRTQYTIAQLRVWTAREALDELHIHATRTTNP